MTKDTETGAAGTPSFNDADLILAPTVAALMGIKYNSFRTYRATGQPTPSPLGKRGSNHVWSRSQVETWIAARDVRAEA